LSRLPDARFGSDHRLVFTEEQLMQQYEQAKAAQTYACDPQTYDIFSRIEELPTENEVPYRAQRGRYAAHQAQPSPARAARISQVPEKSGGGASNFSDTRKLFNQLVSAVGGDVKRYLSNLLCYLSTYAPGFLASLQVLLLTTNQAWGSYDAETVFRICSTVLVCVACLLLQRAQTSLSKNGGKEDKGS
jgi:hypothetical protein